MPHIADLTAYIGIFFGLAGTIGCFLAIKLSYTKEKDLQRSETNKIQSEVIEALKEQVEALKDQLEDLKREVVRQQRVLSTVQYALKGRGIQIVVDGDFITFTDTAIPTQARVIPIRKDTKGG